MLARRPTDLQSSYRVDVDVPTIDIPQLSALENVTIPSTVIDALTDLNSSIPTLDEFRASMNSLISTPIEALRTNVRTTLSNRTIEVEMLPVPAKQTVELCQDLDTTWIDDVGHDLAKFVKLAIGLVILLMVLFMLACEFCYHLVKVSAFSATNVYCANIQAPYGSDTATAISSVESCPREKLGSGTLSTSRPTQFTLLRHKKRSRNQTSSPSSTLLPIRPSSHSSPDFNNSSQ